MTKADVVIDEKYIAKVSGKRTIVKIICPRSIGCGWTARNCITGRTIFIRSAQRLHRAVSESEFQKLVKDLSEDQI